MTPQAFWRTTPCKLNALAKLHIELNNESKEKKDSQGYIDQVL